MASDPAWRSEGASLAVAQARELAEDGAVRDAMALLQSADSNHANPWVQAVAGHILADAGRDDEAIHRYGAALAVHPTAGATVALRGDSRLRLGHWRHALADYERALYLGLTDLSRRSALISELVDLYGFAAHELGSPAAAGRAQAYRSGFCPRRLASPERHASLAGGWVPGVRFGRIVFGERIPPTELPLLGLAPVAEEAWGPHRWELGLTVYIEGGRVDCVKSRHHLGFGGRELIGAGTEEIAGIFGAPDEIVSSGASPCWHFSALGASLFFTEGALGEAVVCSAWAPSEASPSS